MKTHYTYDIWADRQILTVPRCFEIGKRLLETFEETLAYVASIETHYLDDFSIFDTCFELLGHIIKELRFIFRSYYELWILRHVLRVLVWHYLSIDFDWVYVQRNRYARFVKSQKWGN